MKKLLLPLLAGAMLPLPALAADGWTGTGELGLAATRGNTRSENLNARLGLKYEDPSWKHQLGFDTLRSKGETTVIGVAGDQIVEVSRYDLTANRYVASASTGYKLDERSYVVGAARYENDEFAAYDYQWVVSVGYGYTLIKNPSTELAVEVGPGYRRQKPADVLGPEVVDGRPLRHGFPAESDVVGRGLVSFRHAFNDSTAFVNTLLVEAGSDNTFVQNDAGLQVDMSKKLALKVGYQVRRNTDVAVGKDKTDQLMTTNLVYNFM